jgi:hypothetical protein
MKYISLNNLINIDELKEMSKKMEDCLVKAVVDIDLEVMAVDAPMHVDEEQYLIEEYGSVQKNLWGINLYPFEFGTDRWLEFDSMINIRPWQSNRSRSVECQETQNKIRLIVSKLVQ